jgi:MFS family permease
LDAAPTLDPASPQKIARDTTFYYESRRAVFGGIIESAAMTFLVYLAVTVYQASDTAKAYLQAGGNYGLLLSPLVVFIAARKQWRGTRLGAGMMVVGGVGFLAAALIPSQTVFIVGSLIGLVSGAAAIPLFTQMYQENFPHWERGKLFSRVISIRIFSAIAFGYIGGKFLDWRLDYYQWMMLVFAAALFISAYCLSRCPSQPLKAEGHHLPFKGLHYLRDDPLFRLTLISWMLMGVANLMMVYMRVVYLADPRFGEQLSPTQIALVTLVIPNAARLLLSTVWGKLFDRMNFFAMRITLNIGFALGGLMFYTDRDMSSLVIGALIFGVANAGGDIAWSLWVTKLAPADRVAEYMSVHTFFTGVRGTLAPHLAFFFVNAYSMQALSHACAALILLASVMLVPEMRAAKDRPVMPPDESD